MKQKSMLVCEQPEKNSSVTYLFTSLQKMTLLPEGGRTEKSGWWAATFY